MVDASDASGFVGDITWFVGDITWSVGAARQAE